VFPLHATEKLPKMVFRFEDVEFVPIAVVGENEDAKS